MLKRIINKLSKIYYNSSARRFEEYLRKKGITIGNDIFWGNIKTINIDTSRPSLVSIGSNVRINTGFNLFTHDYSSMVFLNKFSDFVNSTSSVNIGNNIYFGRNCSVLKGVSIGDNCIIGYGSIVTSNIPPNSIAVGIPAKVICSLEEYYNKKKEKGLTDAVEYAKSIVHNLHRIPDIMDFREEFPYFWNEDNCPNDYNTLVRFQLKDKYESFKKNNKPIFKSFEDFLEYCLDEDK